MTDILEWEHPDFVVYTGDLMSAEVMYPNGSETVDQLLQPVIKGNYRCGPWPNPNLKHSPKRSTNHLFPLFNIPDGPPPTEITTLETT